MEENVSGGGRSLGGGRGSRFANVLRKARGVGGLKCGRGSNILRRSRDPRSATCPVLSPIHFPSHPAQSSTLICFPQRFSSCAHGRNSRISRFYIHVTPPGFKTAYIRTRMTWRVHWHRRNATRFRRVFPQSVAALRRPRDHVLVLREDAPDCLYLRSKTSPPDPQPPPSPPHFCKRQRTS